MERCLGGGRLLNSSARVCTTSSTIAPTSSTIAPTSHHPPHASHAHLILEAGTDDCQQRQQEHEDADAHSPVHNKRRPQQGLPLLPRVQTVSRPTRHRNPDKKEDDVDEDKNRGCEAVDASRTAASLRWRALGGVSEIRHGTIKRRVRCPEAETSFLTIM